MIVARNKWANFLWQGARISFSGQVNNYRNTVSQVVNLLGDENAAGDYLSKCIYSIGLGSNDYLNNYFMPTIYSTSRRYNVQQYADVLLQQYKQQLVVYLLVPVISLINIITTIFWDWGGNYLLSDVVYITDIVQLWSKKICSNWSGASRLQSKWISTEQPRWVIMCRKNKCSEPDLQRWP